MIASRSRLARPRVLSFSSRVAWNDGHIVPSRFFRQAPTPAHSSAAGSRPPSAEKSNVVGTDGRHIGRAITQVRRQRRGIDDLAGVEQVLRVERPLQLAERLVEHRAVHLLLERAADQAVAVLARERTAILEHQLGDLLGDRLELPHALLGLEVDHRPDVQAADRGMSVDPGRGPVTRDDRQKLGDVVAQVLGATAVSSTNEIALASPFSAIESPSAIVRSFQTRACAAGSVIGQMVIAEPASLAGRPPGRPVGAAARRRGRHRTRSAGSRRDRPRRKSRSRVASGLSRVLSSTYLSTTSTAAG